MVRFDGNMNLVRSKGSVGFCFPGVVTTRDVVMESRAALSWKVQVGDDDEDIILWELRWLDHDTVGEETCHFACA